MGNKIGDYIHYSAANYLHEGTNEYGGFKAWKSQREEIFKEHRRKNSANLTQTERQTIEDALNGILHTNESIAPAIQAKVQKQVEDLLVKKYQDSLQAIDWETGNIVMKSSTANKIGIAKEAVNEVGALLKRSQRLEKVLLEGLASGEANTTEAKRALKTVRQLEKDYQAMINTTSTELKQLGKVEINMKGNVGLQTKLGEMRNTLNDLIKEFAAYPAIQLQKGDLFEIMLSLLPEVIDEVIDAAITGNLPENIAYNKEYFADQYITQNFGDFLEKTRKSQGKIDVHLTWKGQDALEKQLKVSAKNVSFAKPYIHILSDSTLLFMIQDLDGELVNHFLNLFASHRRNDYAAKGSEFTRLRALMLEEMRLVLFYKALTGDNEGRSSANIFAVNDNMVGQVKIYDMDTLIDKAEKNISELRGIQINNRTFAADNPRFVNKMSSSPATRISALLAQVRKSKVSVSMNIEKMLR